MKYKVIKRQAISVSDFERELNEWASRGWRVVATLNAGFNKDNEIILEQDDSIPKEIIAWESARDTIQKFNQGA